MSSSKTTAVSLHSSARHRNGDVRDLNAAWEALSQSKVALRHIENRLEAAPGTGVLLESVMDPKKHASRKLSRRAGRGADDAGGSSKRRGHGNHSPEKSSSRSPLRNATLDSNVRKNNVEFREPLASFREATPPTLQPSQLEACSTQSASGPSLPPTQSPSDPSLSQLVYQRDTRDRQTDGDLDSTHSSALASTEVRYLNDRSALDATRPPPVQTALAAAGEDCHPRAPPCASHAQSLPPARADLSASSSPGSTSAVASQRLENLRRRQPDEKLEKLKERIRKQREHLEEAAERDKLLGYLEQPIRGAVGSSSSGTVPTAKATVRKVAPAPPAPVYRGFNSSETKIKTADGKVWKEEEFHNLSRDFYMDLSRQLAESSRQQHQSEERGTERPKDRRPPKPVRKVHRSSEPHPKQVIGPASWREGQKLVKMVLGPAPRQPPEGRPQTSERPGPAHRSSSDARPEPARRPRPNSTERPRSGRGRSGARSHTTTTLAPQPAAREEASAAASTELLSADIQGILDDLQMECREAEEEEERARERSGRGHSGTRGRGRSSSRSSRAPAPQGAPLSRASRSGSPANRRAERPADAADAEHRKRHYDADTVRQYIVHQQEGRRRRQMEERRAQREEAERRNQRLQELYRKQRVVAKAVALPSEAPVATVQRRLQETFTKLLQEEAELEAEGEHEPPAALPTNHHLQRPMYQPSGESDKENKRLEVPQSPSSSDMSLSEQPPRLSRNDLDMGVLSWLQPDRTSVASRAPQNGGALAPPADHLFSEILRLETEAVAAAAAAGHTHRPHRQSPGSNGSRSKMARIDAIKATAASLSNRIESEARKLAGEGTNYGTLTSMDADVVLAPQRSPFNQDAGRWASAASPPVREPFTMPSDNLVERIQRSEDLAIRIQKILSSADQSSFDGDGLPGVGNLHSYRRPSPKKKSLASATDLKHHSYRQEGRGLLNGLEEVQRLGQPRGLGANGDWEERRNHGKEPRDSSGGSISEGPLQSDEDPSPPRRATNHVPGTAGSLAAVDYCAGRQREDDQPLAQFQRDAERYSAVSPAAPQRNGTRAAWEELSKGSPLSVINIYTKNLHSHLKAPEELERTSPSVRSPQSGVSPGDAAAYEDDFVSSRSSGATGQSKRRYSGHSSVKSHFEELMRRSPYDKRNGDFSSPHPSHHSSLQSPHLSSGSSSVCRGSRGKRGTASDRSDATVPDELKSPCSPHSETRSADSRKRGSERSSAHSQPRSHHSDGTLGGAPEPSPRSLGQDGDKTPAGSPGLASLPGTPAGPGSPPDRASPGVSPRSGSSGGAGGVAQGAAASPPTRSPPHAQNDGRLPSLGGREETTGERQYAPGVLRQRMTAELSYLESIEESVRQLGDVERLRGVSMAQQESVSLAQILKAQQQRHERELYELKIKAEREALETQLHMEESRQRAARAHAELQESMAVNHQQTLGGLQEASAKMMSQQAEAARYTADAARHIKEMAELTRSQMVPGDLTCAAEIQSRTALDQHRSSHKKSPQARTESDSSRSEGSCSRPMPGEPLSSLDSLSQSDSLPYRRPEISGGDSSSYLDRSHDSSAQRDWRRMDGRKEEPAEEGREPARRGKEATGNSSVEEEEAATAADDSLVSESIHSVLNEKADSTSVATDYSLKFDESMTEDEIEERSFRSLLPSEAHRRVTLDKKSRPHEESEEEPASHDRSLASMPLNRSKDGSQTFASGQDSFTQFTMDMVRQYMVDEEVRLQHQGSLLHLRQKALKEKTKTEMAWLEHQKRRLRDKGEDDKMPPLRKKQRGLLMKLQQEQAEIKRLQEANKVARKERLLLLKQQEEIERMRSNTLRLKERLKSAGGDAPPETPLSETPVSEAASPSLMLACRDPRSPSPPLSVSGSETSSIMQKLKKMHSHADEKHCSPVHYFLSVFKAHHWASLSVCLPNLHPKLQLFIYNHLVRFLTKREQQLLQRRHHAVELLQWKERLDREEAEVRRMEKEALGVCDRQAHHQNQVEVQPGRWSPEAAQRETSDVGTSSGCRQNQEPLSDEKRGRLGEEDYSTVSPERSGSSAPASSFTAPPASVPETSMASFQSSQDITSASPSPGKPSTPANAILSTTASAVDCSGGSGTKMLLRPPPRPAGHTPGQARTRPSDPPTATHTDPMSDQSDIESRIRALKEELKKRKSMAYQLKKEQKKRHKERLKAQEASLLKQLESYDDFIQKTKAELNNEPASKSAAEPQINAAASATENSKALPPHSSDSSSRRSRAVSDSDEGHSSIHGDRTPLGRSRSTSLPEELSEEDTPTVTPTPAHGSPEQPSPGVKALGAPDGPSRTSIYKGDRHLRGGAEDGSVVSNHRSDISEDLAGAVSSKSGNGHSEVLLKLETEDGPPSHQDSSVSNHVPSENEDDIYSPCGSRQDERGLKIRDSSLPGEPKLSWHQEGTSSSSDNASLSSKIEAPLKEADVSRRPSVTVTDGYHDDFESSAESSPRDGRRSSQPTSPVSPPSGGASGQASYSRSPLDQSRDDEEVEEDIAGELSEHSEEFSDSRHSGKLLDLNDKTAESPGETRNELNHSPALSPSLSRVSPVEDEMPTFCIGDRVLVSHVQPGTLRFKGPTRFANGFWAGVELDKSEGSNNGTYDGVAYFVCEERHGIFAPSDKIARLPERFDVSVDTTEDEDSFVDDLSERSKRADDEKSAVQPRKETEESPRDDPSGSGYKEPRDEAGHPSVRHQNKDALDANSLNSRNHHTVPNGRIRDGSLEFDNAPTTLLISDLDKMGSATRGQKQRTPHTGHKDLDSHHSSVTPNECMDDFDIKSNEGKAKERDSLGAFADTLLNDFVKDAVTQLSQVKLAKERKIMEANRMNGELFTDRLEGEGRVSPSEQKDGLPFFLETEKEELSSPELCNRPESPVLGASGQEELAKRLAELELSRELLDDLGDDQDWFEEDFGLKSRREQQRRQQRQKEEEEEDDDDDDEENRVGGGRPVTSVGEPQAKTPPRPELPLPLLPKLPEQPPMVVPHSATEVERLVHAATAEIWQSCGLGAADVLTLAGLPVPRPSLGYLGKEANGQDQEDLCIRSYRQGVYDLTWEILQEIFGEDPNANQPLWLKPRRVNSSYSHRVRMPGNISTVQEFIATKVLKLYGLRKDQSQKTDWQKMLKFGRKKRDRVDHILVQELHEEEAQWVNYDEDELFVKMQLADSIFDMLLKDTADVLTQIHEQRAARDALS
ncbi:centrosome-associated protein 350 isoform X2 [Gadus macrocephalus]|uniref:centrosome-associated protein 350 isoform X2 n=1 Tax=Gadus macrocephalus TaxID=80720 RepID=UPI0028CB9114|nr:centrosome-associated protein 350 isoform X2 [Gadus macrocephalus]